MENSFETYKNSTYKNERTKKQVITIQWPAHASDTENIIYLNEPLRLDSSTEVYLDSVVTAPTTPVAVTDKNILILKINELQIKHNSGTTELPGEKWDGVPPVRTQRERPLASILFNCLAIPNTRSSTTGVHSHRINKYNYISTLNPQILNSFNVTFGFMKESDPWGLLPQVYGAWITLMFVSKD